MNSPGPPVKYELATESVSPDEQAHADNLVRLLRAKMERDYSGSRFLRDAHPKMHGCVRAELVIEPNLPEALRVGVFGQSGPFQAWVRFSNQSGTVTPDVQPDIRGMAMKLLDVDGVHLTDDQKSQDFILISDDRFVTRDIAEFDQMVQALLSGRWQSLWFFLTHWRVSRNLWMSLKRQANPLDIQYYSVSPYLLGTRAVKYSVRPRHAANGAPPPHPDRDFLRQAMAARLAEREAVFDFLVQFQVDARVTPIEDLSVAWPEKRAPFQKVATLTIPRQTFDSAAQRAFGDNLSFNPWHALKEHQPLGSINRARRRIYQELSAFRHQQNRVLVHRAAPKDKDTLDADT